MIFNWAIYYFIILHFIYESNGKTYCVAYTDIRGQRVNIKKYFCLMLSIAQFKGELNITLKSVSIFEITFFNYIC